VDQEQPANPEREIKPNEPQPVTCEKCKVSWKAPIPQATVLNHRLFSVVIFSHDTALVCPGCGAEYTFSLASLQYHLQIVALPPAQQPGDGAGRIIIPPVNVKIPRKQ
jgi:hypothetical protein